MAIPSLMVEPDVRELVARTRAGDPDALAALYRAHAPALHAVAWRLSGSTADADDLVQDLFVGLPDALRSFEGRGALGAWLRRVMVRMTLMRARAGGRRREEGTDEALADLRAGSDIEGLPARLDLAAAIERLPPSLRQVFVLREVEGYPYDEIAELLGIRRNAAEVRLHRARHELRRLLRRDA